MFLSHILGDLATARVQNIGYQCVCIHLDMVLRNCSTSQNNAFTTFSNRPFTHVYLLSQNVSRVKMSNADLCKTAETQALFMTCLACPNDAFLPHTPKPHNKYCPATSPTPSLLNCRTTVIHYFLQQVLPRWHLILHHQSTQLTGQILVSVLEKVLHLVSSWLHPAICSSI